MKKQVVISVLLWASVMLGFNGFVSGIQNRVGIVLHDPVVAALHPKDFTMFIFALIYGAFVMAALVFLKRSRDVQLFFISYAILTLVRMVMMALVAIDPPPQMIVLRDPIVELFGHKRVLTRDLFFSGHTSVLFLLGLMAPGAWKSLFFAVTAVVAGMLLFQHVHYSIDVVAAPFFSFGAFKAGTALLPAFDWLAEHLSLENFELQRSSFRR